MTHGSLFNGIGGFQLAAEWMGWENIFSCEIDKFCNKVTKYHFPNCVQHEDIRTTDFTIYRGRIDIITGGFPCQPYSQAGKRKGKEDERHLWPEMLRAIREIQPGWIVGENVPGLLNWERGMVLDEIKAGLEAEGFEVFPSLVLPACGKDAPHRRERIWIVAHSDSNRNRYIGKQDRKAHSLQGIGWEAIHARRLIETDTEIVANPNGLRLEKHELQQSKLCEQFSEGRIVTNSNNQGLQGSKVNGGAGSIRQNGNEQFTGLLQSDWHEFPTQSPLCGRNDGISNRVDRIKALGNAIVPQVVYEIFKAIEQTNEKL